MDTGHLRGWQETLEDGTQGMLAVVNENGTSGLENESANTEDKIKSSNEANAVKYSLVQYLFVLESWLSVPNISNSVTTYTRLICLHLYKFSQPMSFFHEYSVIISFGPNSLAFLKNTQGLASLASYAGHARLLLPSSYDRHSCNCFWPFQPENWSDF